MKDKMSCTKIDKNNKHANYKVIDSIAVDKAKFLRMMATLKEFILMSLARKFEKFLNMKYIKPRK